MIAYSWLPSNLTGSNNNFLLLLFEVCCLSSPWVRGTILVHCNTKHSGYFKQHGVLYRELDVYKIIVRVRGVLYGTLLEITSRKIMLNWLMSRLLLCHNQAASDTASTSSFHSLAVIKDQEATPKIIYSMNIYEVSARKRFFCEERQIASRQKKIWNCGIPGLPKKNLGYTFRKEKYEKSTEHKLNTMCNLGRGSSYSDYLVYMAEKWGMNH